MSLTINAQESLRPYVNDLSGKCSQGSLQRGVETSKNEVSQVREHFSYYSSGSNESWKVSIGFTIGGIGTLILGLALAALAITAFIFGDIPWGITAAVLAGIAIPAGIAAIVYERLNS